MGEISRLNFIRRLGVPKRVEYRNYDFKKSFAMIWRHYVKIW